MNFWYAFCRTLCLAYFKVFHRLRVYGIENIPAGQAILAPNHASNYDPILVGISCPEEIHFLAKEELFHGRFLRKLIRSLNAHPIAGKGQDLSSFKTISKLLTEGKKVVIFPEGSRTLTGELNPIKPGIGMLAQRQSCPIVPIYIHGTYSIWPVMRYFPKLWGKTAVVFGPPIDLKNFEHENKKIGQEAICKALAEELHNLKSWYMLTQQKN